MIDEGTSDIAFAGAQGISKTDSGKFLLSWTKAEGGGDKGIFSYIVSYRDLFPTISQTITSTYPDAEVVIREKKDYINFTDKHGVVRTTSIRK